MDLLKKLTADDRPAIGDLEEEIARLRKVLEFYANRNHWMSITENGDHSNLIALGPNFDGTSNGWVEAAAALKIDAA